MTSQTIYVAPEAVNLPRTWAELAFGALQYCCIGALGAQLIIDFSDTNILAAMIATMSSTVTLQYLLRTRAFGDVPLSSFAILGFCLTTQWGAVLGQSLAWTPIVENLRDPVRTFALLGLFQCVAIFAHAIHRTLRGLIVAREFCARTLRRLGIFDLPAPGSLWLMGGIGFAGYAVGAAPGDVNLGDRLLAGFWPFAWAPFVIPILHLRLGSAYCNLRVHGAALVIYILMAFALGMALNYRVVMVQGITTAGLLSFLSVLQSRHRLGLRVLWRFAPLALLAALTLAPMADLASAMAIVRGDRGHLPPMDLVKETVEVFQDKNAIRRFKQSVQTDSQLAAYDEAYIANSVVARFVETKFHDNSFYFTKGMSDGERAELGREMVDRAWSLLPYPMLRSFKIPVDKTIMGHTVGDFYANLRTGVPLGGLKTGSLLADCLALFQDLAVIAYVGLCLALFFVWDSQCLRDASGAIQISVLAMLQSYRLFTFGITNESLVSALALFVRGFWQNLAFYLLTYSIARIVFPPFRPYAQANAKAGLSGVAVAVG